MKRTTLIITILIFSILDMCYAETGKVYTRSALSYNISNLKINQKIANGDTSAIFKNTKQFNRLKGLGTEFGFGYSLCRNIRTEFVINTSQSNKKLKKIELISTLGKINNIIKAKNGKYSSNNGSMQKQSINLQEVKLGSIANIYYDFYNTSELIPYIVAGIGIKKISLTSEILGYEVGANNNKLKLANEIIKSENSKSFEYQVGIGTHFVISQDIFVDISYKVSNYTGDFKFKKNDIEVGGILNNKGIENKTQFATPKFQYNMTTGIRFIF